jgi:hypothetical protein
LNYKENEIDNNINLTDYGSIMGNYTLYSLYDQMTILVDDIINWKIDNKSLLNFFDNMKEQTLKDIQIIFILPNDSKYNHIRSSIKKQKIFKIFSPTSNLELDTFNLMNLIRGKFILILEKFIMFEKNEFEKLISLTNGKIDNIFESQSQNNSLYIINI